MPIPVLGAELRSHICVAQSAWGGVSLRAEQLGFTTGRTGRALCWVGGGRARGEQRSVMDGVLQEGGPTSPRTAGLRLSRSLLTTAVLSV